MCSNCCRTGPDWYYKGHRVMGSHSAVRVSVTLTYPAGATVWPCLGLWDVGNVSARAPALWDHVRQSGCDLGGPGAAGGDRLSRTGPRVTFLRMPDALWCLVIAACRQLVLLLTLADHPCLKKCPARFKFSQECGPSERPVAHLDPRIPVGVGVECAACSECVAPSVGTIESLCKLIPESRYLHEEFTCARWWSR